MMVTGMASTMRAAAVAAILAFAAGGAAAAQDASPPGLTAPADIPAPTAALATLDIARARLLEGDRAGALDPAAAAVEAAEEGAPGAPPQKLAELALALAELDFAEADFNMARSLALTVSAAEEAGHVDDLLVAAGWADVARVHDARGVHSDAYAPIEQARLLLAHTPESPPPAFVLAFDTLVGHVALQTGRYGEAAKYMAQVARGVPPMLDGEAGQEINGEWVYLVSTIHAALAAHETRTGELVETVPLVWPQNLADPPCEPVWEKHKTPRVRNRYERRTPGAVLLSFEITPEGGTQNIETLAVLPRRPALEEAAIDAFSDWRADPETVAACQGVPFVAAARFVGEDR